MAMQGYGSAPSRNTIKAAGAAKPGKVTPAAPHATTVVASGAGKSPVGSGSSVAGFSGTGVKAGKVK